MRKLYTCGVDWQHEIGEAPDLEGKQPFYSSVEKLKKDKSCWKECGIVEIEMNIKQWIEPQDLFGKNKENNNE